MRKIVLLIGFIIIVTRLLVSCNKLPFNDHFSEVVYIQTNNYAKSNNAIIAYRNNGDGKLLPVLGGPFFTGGSGIGNPQQIEGPNNSDNEIRISNDRKFLLAVNSGSNTIAVFKINIDGTLSPVPGSPFPSGGETPVSIDMWQQYVYVVNKSHNPITPTTSKPNYTVFTLEGDGSLTPVVNGTLEVRAGASPASVAVVKNGLVFGTDFLGLRVNGPSHTVLEVFTNDNTGKLTLLPATPLSVRSARPQGIWQNPTSNVVYVASANGTLGGVITMFQINPHPEWGVAYFPDYMGYVYSGPGAFNVRTNNSGDHMYVLNSQDNSVSVFSTSNPVKPVPMQKMALKNAGPTYKIYDSVYTSSECFSMGLSSNEKFLYAVSQHTNPDFNIGNYNYLHVLSVNSNGTVEEPEEPIQLPVPNNVRPRGVAVYRIN